MKVFAAWLILACFLEVSGYSLKFSRLNRENLGRAIKNLKARSGYFWDIGNIKTRSQLRAASSKRSDKHHSIHDWVEWDIGLKRSEEDRENRFRETQVYKSKEVVQILKEVKVLSKKLDKLSKPCEDYLKSKINNDIIKDKKAYKVYEKIVKLREKFYNAMDTREAMDILLYEIPAFIDIHITEVVEFNNEIFPCLADKRVKLGEIGRLENQIAHLISMLYEIEFQASDY